MAWRCFVLVGMWLLAATTTGCGDDDSPGDGGGSDDVQVDGGGLEDVAPDAEAVDVPDACPIERPAAGGVCAVPETETCRYLKLDCTCGPDAYYNFTCRSGIWELHEDFDCWPCPDASGGG
jgi:hypothetical protein